MGVHANCRLEPRSRFRLGFDSLDTFVNWHTTQVVTALRPAPSEISGLCPAQTYDPHTPQLARQFVSMYSAFLLHSPPSAHAWQLSSLSMQSGPPRVRLAVRDFLPPAARRGATAECVLRWAWFHIH